MTFGALLARRTLVGRDAELAALRTLHEPGGPLVAVVHGVAGTGKSTLLRTFVAEHDHVTVVDGRAIEPTPAGFTAAAGEHPGLLVIDTFERLRLLDDWLRHTYFPSLPDDTRVVIATRDAPGAVWRATFGEHLHVIGLGPLAPADAHAVLEAHGLDAEQAAAVNRFVRGHPLSLQLAASALKEHPDAVIPTVTQELAALYLDGLDAETRAALDAACVLRRVTRSLLPEGFERLATLPFVELTPEGLVIHDTVREAVSALLRATDPVRHRAHRTAAWRQIRAELADGGGWASVADMIALVEEPLVREAFFPTAVQHYAVETARPSDRDAILAIVARHHDGATRALMADWWDAVPDAFRVARSPRGTVVAFTILCDLARVPQGLFIRDPLCQAWREHLRAHPVPKGQRVLAARLALAHATGTSPSPCFSALLRDVERASLQAGMVRRIYSGQGGDALDAELEPIGYLPIDGGATVCDLGPESVPGWLSDLAARDLAVGHTALDADARELTLEGRKVGLTKLECDVLRYLRDREGQVVERSALLRDVWGYEWSGGANAVDVAISGLRRKLGERAKAVETVRGKGFRFRGF